MSHSTQNQSFWRRFSQAILLAWYGKKLNVTQDKSTHSPIKRNVLQHQISTEKLKPHLVAFYDIRPGNGTGLFSKENIREEISKEK